MLPFRNFLKLVRTYKNASALCSSSAFQSELDGGQPLGDQRAHYKVDLRKRSRTGKDSFFDVRDYERNDGGGAIKGFGNNNYQRDNFQHNNYERPQVSGFGGRSRVYGAGAGLKPVNYHSTANLPLINRDFYRVHPDVEERPQEEIDAFLAKHDMTLDGNDLPRPVFSFEEANLHPKILSILEQKYDAPTSIQSISWPVAMSGRDLISIAKTGSGKTLCFLLPGIMHTISQQKRGDANAERNAPTVLVVVPTRELAQQVEEVAREYCQALNLKLVCCFGGASKNVQAGHLARGVDICVATPGRLLDFLESGALSLHRCSYLVLDEADRMLDMGFEPQIRKVVTQIRPDRQTLMFSATWPKEIRELASDFQTDPVFLNVGSMELSANHNIKQNVSVVMEEEKIDHLFKLLNEISKEPNFKALIFVETKRKADHLTTALRRSGLAALSIHGDKSQSERDWALRNFREGTAKILLATDVAARGLDVDDIKHVINYDYPNSSENYVHRIGRTGRRDQKGTSHTYLTPDNAKQVADLIKVLKEAKQHISEDLALLVEQGFSQTAADASVKWRGLYGSVGRGAGGDFSKSGARANHYDNSYGGGGGGRYGSGGRTDYSNRSRSQSVGGRYQNGGNGNYKNNNGHW